MMTRGWLALPRLRCHEGLAGSSHEAQESTWRGRDAQLDYALRALSWNVSWPAPVTEFLARAVNMPAEIIREAVTPGAGHT